MKIAIILAVSDNGVIGRNNTLPWKLPADLKFFQAITTGKTIVMGRKTYESLGKALKNRRNIVLTRNSDFQPLDAEVVHSWEALFELCASVSELFIIGGATLYQQILQKKLVDKIYLTRVKHNFEGDAFFELPNPAEWQLEFEMHFPADEKHAHPYAFMTMVAS